MKSADIREDALVEELFKEVKKHFKCTVFTCLAQDGSVSVNLTGNLSDQIVLATHLKMVLEDCMRRTMSTTNPNTSTMN